MLHFNDNEQAPARDDPARDRLYKIRPLLDMLNENFKEYYTPQKEMALDESLLLFKGILLFKQYMPLKRSVQFMKYLLEYTPVHLSAIIHSAILYPASQSQKN